MFYKKTSETQIVSILDVSGRGKNLGLKFLEHSKKDGTDSVDEISDRNIVINYVVNTSTEIENSVKLS